MNSSQFSPIAFIQHLIIKMGLENESPEQLEILKQNMFEALRRDMLQGAQEGLEPELVDVVLEQLADEQDPELILTRLVQSSPGAQVGMILAIEAFKERTLEAFKQLSH